MTLESVEDYLVYKFIKCLSDLLHNPSNDLMDYKFIYFEKGKFRSKGDVSILKRALKILDSEADQLVHMSEKEWCFPLKAVISSEEYIHLFLNKSVVFRKVFENVNAQNKSYGFWKIKRKIFLEKDNSVKNKLNQMRINMALDLSKRLVQKQGFELMSESTDDSLKLYFTNRSEVPIGFQRIFVMGVESGKKNSELSPEEFTRLISSDVSNVSNRIDKPISKENLIDACIKFNLFHSCVASPCHLTPIGECSHNTKDAIFVLYNYVRLKTILTSYQSKVTEHVYPPLPPIEEIDFSLLTKDEEWGILLDHILRFPQLVAEFSTKLEKESKLHLHSFFIMLVVFSNQISRYYRRVRVLTEPKPHLVQVMFARLHLLCACLVIYDVLFECLAIIPPDTM